MKIRIIYCGSRMIGAFGSNETGVMERIISNYERYSNTKILYWSTREVAAKDATLNRAQFESFILKQAYFGYVMGDPDAIHRDWFGYSDDCVNAAWMGFCERLHHCDSALKKENDFLNGLLKSHRII